MFKIQNSLSLLLLGSVFAFSHLGLAAAPANILDAAPGYKPKVVCSDTYGEKTFTIPGDGGDPDTHDMEPKPEKISAKVIANIAGFDSSEINSDLEVSLQLGSFQFSAPLSDSDEAVDNGGVFPANKKKATFSFPDQNDDSDHPRTAGKIVFAWTATRLTVTLVSADILAAGLDEIGASDFIGLYEDDSDNGDHPSGSVGFISDPTLVSVDFGSATGERNLLFKGQSKTTYKKFGSDDAGTLEEFFLQSVTLVGTTDTKPPEIKVTAKDADNDGIATVTITTDELVPPIITLFNAETYLDDTDPGITPVAGTPDDNGVTTYTAQVPLTKRGNNTIYIVATDGFDNTGLTTKKVKTKHVFPPAQ